MEKKTVILISLISFLSGLVLGFFISPVKQGFGNNCGNHNHYYSGPEEDTENKEEIDGQEDQEEA